MSPRCVLALLALLVLAIPAVAAEPELTPDERTRLEKQAVHLQFEAGQLLQKDRPTEAVEKLTAALAIRRRLMPPERFPAGNFFMLSNLHMLSTALARSGRPAEAVPYLEAGLAMSRLQFPTSKHPDGHPYLATALNNLGVMLDESGAPELAVPIHEEALAMRRRLAPEAKFPDGHDHIAFSLQNLGSAYYSMGNRRQALHYWGQGLELRRRLYPESKYPDGHRDVASSLNNLGGVHREMGADDKALPYFEQALAMNRCLFREDKFPLGHPDIATCLDNLGQTRDALGTPKKALEYHEQALAMRRKLYPESDYPDGHPDLALSYTHMAQAFLHSDDPERALANFEKSRAMCERLYPKAKYPAGHSNLAQAIFSVGITHFGLGNPHAARPYCEQAVAMYRRLAPASKYSDGHPLLAHWLGGLGIVHLALDEARAAVPLLAESLAMRHRLLTRELAAASADDALALAQIPSPEFSAYLSALRSMPRGDLDAFRAVWNHKAIVTQVLQRRRMQARAAATKHAATLDRLRINGRRADMTLRETRLSAAERDKQLAELADERARLERDLATAMPEMKRALSADDLQRALPPGAAFIDLVTYRRMGKIGAGQVDSYTAFVVTPGRPAVRVELGEAAPINAAIDQWRRAIESRTDTDAADTLRRRLWQPLAERIPNGTTTLYVAPDDALAGLPWAALPILPSPLVGEGTGVRGQTVLVDKLAVAVVPHGRFLLEYLTAPRSPAPSDGVLALGAVAYRSRTWPDLPGTAVELKALADRTTVTLAGADATAAKLLDHLPRVRYAHLATHGFFDADALTAEKTRAADAQKNWQLNSEGTVRRVAAKSPLGFTGLVLADGEVISGLSLVDLPLEHLNLVTLSACETGLGEYTGGEGVQGLQRALHLAGCANVITSLWKVNDAATAALMAKFYHEMWVEKRSPLAALREAQLTIYRRPDLIPDLAGERGAPKLKEAVAVKVDEPSRMSGRILSPTKLWAAFVLSGVGR